MALSDIAYSRLSQLRSAAKNTHIEEYTYERRETGMYHFTSFRLAQHVLDRLEAHNKAVEARQANATGLACRAPAPKKTKGRVRADGQVPVTQQIRMWVHNNPDATKADALSHFSGLNPSTVGVQFGKAKKGLV